MTTAAHLVLADTFLAFHRQHAGEFGDDYAQWAHRQRLDRDDRTAIRRIVHATLLADGRATSTDPYDYLSIEEAA